MLGGQEHFFDPATHPTVLRTVANLRPRIGVDHVLIARNRPEIGIERPQKTIMFSGASLVSGAGFEPVTFRLCALSLVRRGGWSDQVYNSLNKWDPSLPPEPSSAIETIAANITFCLI